MVASAVNAVLQRPARRAEHGVVEPLQGGCAADARELHGDGRLGYAVAAGGHRGINGISKPRPGQAELAAEPVGEQLVVGAGNEEDVSLEHDVGDLVREGGCGGLRPEPTVQHNGVPAERDGSGRPLKVVVHHAEVQLGGGETNIQWPEGGS